MLKSAAIACALCCVAFCQQHTDGTNSTNKNASKRHQASQTPTKSETPVKPPAPPKEAGQQLRYLNVSGDFTSIQSGPACKGQQACAVVLDENHELLGEASAIHLEAGKATIAFNPTSNKAAKFVMIGNSDPPVQEFPISDDQIEMNATIGGDFCKDTLSPCTPYTAGNLKNISVLAADGVEQHPATVIAVDRSMALVRFRAPREFRAAWLTFTDGANIPHAPVAFVMAEPIRTQELIYEHDELESICRLKAGSPSQADCVSTTENDLKLSPLPSQSQVKLLSISNDFMVVRVTAPQGEEPLFITVENVVAGAANNGKSLLVRRTLKPGQNGKLLHVDMTPLDQETVARDFGARIAKRYMVISLDVKNPTSKKMQFSKSAMYFDVDYAQATTEQSKGEHVKDFFYSIGEVVSFGAYVMPDVYRARFKPQGRKFIYGIDQNIRHSPLNYLAVLASYDHTTEVANRNFQAFELFGSVLSTIATSGMVAQVHNSAFRDATSVLTGVFTPGLRGVMLNIEGINRRRANLVAQTLQDAIQIPATGSTTTMVLLPRYGILGIENAEIPVVVDRILDVHLEPEVITPAGENVVPLLSLKNGYTKEQVRQSLGEESGGDTNPDGTSYFTYRKGPYSRVTFGSEGTVVSSVAREIPEQIDAASNLLEAMTILDAKNMAQVVHKIQLVDNSVVLTDIPGATKNFHYDEHGSRTADYSFKFDSIESLKGKSKKEFETALTGMAPTTGRKNAIRGANPNGRDVTLEAEYPSPDIQDGRIVLTFQGTKGTKVKDDTIVDSISFQGPKPNSVKD